MGFLFLYVKETYVEGHANPLFSFIIVSLVLFPLIYEGIQLFNGGAAEYFGDFGNWLDIAFLWGSIAMSILHYL